MANNTLVHGGASSLMESHGAQKVISSQGKQQDFAVESPMPGPAKEHLLTPREVAAQLTVSERWVRDHATRRSPRIAVVKLGPLLRFRQSDIDYFVDQQRTDHGLKKRRF